MSQIRNHHFFLFFYFFIFYLFSHDFGSIYHNTVEEPEQLVDDERAATSRDARNFVFYPRRLPIVPALQLCCGILSNRPWVVFINKSLYRHACFNVILLYSKFDNLMILHNSTFLPLTKIILIYERYSIIWFCSIDKLMQNLMTKDIRLSTYITYYIHYYAQSDTDPLY